MMNNLNNAQNQNIELGNRRGAEESKESQKQNKSQKSEPTQSQADQSIPDFKQHLIFRRSGYFSELDRQTRFKKITNEYAMSGILGFGDADLEILKAPMKDKKEKKDSKGNYERQEEQNLKSNPAFNTFTEYDGVAIKTPLNVFERTEKQRVEQDLLWRESGYPFFKANGELISDSDFYDKKISRVLTVTLSENPACQTQRRSAVMCERLNQNKHVGYKLNIYIGKAMFLKHPLQNPNEKQMRQLKKAMKKYRARIDLALIPHYNRIIKLIAEEIGDLENKTTIQPTKEKSILQNENTRIRKLKDLEIDRIKKLVMEIEDLWEKMNQEKTTKHLYNVVYKEYRNQDNINEFELGLVREKDLTSLTTGDETPAELDRRKKVGEDKFYVKLFINGKYVGQTKQVNLNWPLYESTFMEKFQILLYTKPSSIRFDLYKYGLLKDTLIDKVEVGIPGEKMNSKTSSNTLLKEAGFSEGYAARLEQRDKNREKEEKLLKKKQEEERKKKLQKERQEEMERLKKEKDQEQQDLQNDDEEADEEEKLKKEEEENKQKQIEEEKRQEEEQKQEQLDKQHKEEEEKKREEIAREQAKYEGKISFLAEWEGNGPQMPPPNMDSYNKSKKGREQQVMVDRDTDDEEDDESKPFKFTEESLEEIQRKLDEGFHFDVNDPRYEFWIKQQQSIKNQQQDDGIKQDAMMPYQQVISLRQELIKLRQMNPDIIVVPGDEKSCWEDTKIMDQLRQAKQGEEEYIKEAQEKSEKMQRYKQLNQIGIVPEEYCSKKKETKIRINDIEFTLKNRQKEQKKKKKKDSVAAGQITLRNIVREFRFADKDLYLMEKLKQLCTQQRKLQPKPVKNKKQPVGKVNQVKINLYISQGRNVPVKTENIDINNNQVAAGNLPGQPNQFLQNFDNMNMFEPNILQPQNGQLPNSAYSYVGVELRIPDQKKKFLELKEKSISYPKNLEEDYRDATKPCPGNNPNWNSEVTLTYKSNNQVNNEHRLYDPTLSKLKNKFSVMEVTDAANQLYITLFDKRNRILVDSANSYVCEFNDFFLGNLVIPLGQLIRNPQQNATFKINRPLALFGYKIQENSYEQDPNKNPTGQIPRSDYKFVTTGQPTTVEISLTTEPQLDIPEENDLEYYGTKEDSDLLYYAKIYLESLKKNTNMNKKHIKLWAHDLKNQSYFLPRYIHPDGLKPPYPIIESSDNTSIEEAARFVSLIPFKLENEKFKDVPDSFMTCQQFLDIRGGDYEEHAAMLCNFFIYIDKKLKREHYRSFVLLGHAVPEGETFYVVRLNEEKGKQNCVEIWNPQTGECYVYKSEEFQSKFLCCSIGTSRKDIPQDNDKGCPLYSVGCIFDNTNVYINMQKKSAPEQVNWDINNKNYWKPYLEETKKTRIYGQKIPSLQEQIHYEDTPQDDVQELSISIKNFLISRIDKLRQQYQSGNKQNVTDFLNADSEQIKKILIPLLDAVKQKSRLTGISSTLGVDSNEMRKNLQGLNGACQDLYDKVNTVQGNSLYGFPLNFTFTDYEKIWTEVEATGIANIIRNNFQYLLTVECFSDFNYVTSVWVFIGIIFREENQEDLRKFQKDQLKEYQRIDKENQGYLGDQI